MGKKKQANNLGQAIIKNRFGGGRKTNKESHVSIQILLFHRFW